MASIDLILRKDKTKSDGRVPVYIRVLKDRKAQYISIKESVIPDLWIETAQEVDRKHPNAKWLNAKFIKRKSEAKDLVLQAEERKRNWVGICNWFIVMIVTVPFQYGRNSSNYFVCPVREVACN